jgi:hypothetical protein
MEAVMKLARMISRGRLVCVPMLLVALALTGSVAQAAPIVGSTTFSADYVLMDEDTIALSTTFTPHAVKRYEVVVSGSSYLVTPIIGPNALTMVDGTDDFEKMPYTFVAADTLNINNLNAWAFTSDQGNWQTTGSSIDASKIAVGNIDFLLEGEFTPSGTLGGLAPSIAEMRISLNQTGGSVNWTATMAMIPEPATMSLLGLGALAIIRKRRRK